VIMGKAERQKKKAAGIPRKSRAGELAQGVNRVGRARSAHYSGRWRHFAKGAAGQKRPEQQQKGAEVKLDVKTTGGKDAKEARWYAADDVARPLASRKNPKPAKLRKSITPGTVLILLAGRHKGKRVVFLKQLPSGLLLVNGPFALNGVPLRRVNQAYVISTSTRINVGPIDVSKVDDAFFARNEKKAAAAAGDNKKSDGKTFFDDKTKEAERVVSEARKAEQKRVDDALAPVIKAVPDLKRYLKTRFTLTSKTLPHLMRF